MNVGDLLLNRYRLHRPLPGRDAVQRWRATDEQTHTEVDVLLLGASRANADARASFSEVHQVLERLRDAPHLVTTHALHHEGDLEVAVRDPLADHTLADVPGPLPWQVVAAIGAQLGPVVMAAGPSLRGALLPNDVALSESGQPVLAPRGAPLNRVVKGTTQAVAPEAFTGGASDGPTGLYGLGVLLYRLSTGRDPQIGRSGAPPAPPSSHRPGIPASFDKAVLQLLSHDPSRRAGALDLLPPGEVPDLREHVRTVPVGEVRTTTSRHAPSITRHAPSAGWILVRPQVLRDAPPRAHSQLAGLAQVPAATVRDLAERGLPLVIEASRSSAAARRRARELTSELDLPVDTVTSADLSPWMPLVATGLLALVPLLLAPLAAAFGWWFLAVPLLLLVTVLVAGGAVMAWVTSHRRALYRAATRAWQHQGSATGTESLLAPAWAQLAEARVHIAEVDLPSTAEADLRQVMADLEEQLTRLAGRERAIAETHARVDAPALRTRLAALDRLPSLSAEQHAERDRLGRTLADLGAVDDDRALLRVEATRIRDALIEISTVLSQLGDDPSDALLGRLARAARAPEHDAAELERRRRAAAARQTEQPG